MKTFIVGNWKMNFTVGESSLYLHKLLKQLKTHRNLQVIVAPSTIALQPLSLQIDRAKLRLAAQNCFYRDFGAFTGEVSANQLRGIADYCIIGHSERRHIFGETDKIIRAKVAACLRHGITPILCIGETSDQRTFGETTDVLRDQLIGGLSDVCAEDLPKVLIAYEPVWAISSTSAAKLAAPDEVATSVNIIQSQLTALYGSEVSSSLPILFGGSVNPSNAGAYLTIPGVNGLLVGSASLNADHFLDIIEIAKRVSA